MAKTSKSSADRRLLDAGRALLDEKGVSGLSVREAARRAGVNLGLFHYHFKSKDEFVRQLLDETYEEFFARLSLESAGQGEPVERLRRALLAVAVFGRDHRRLLMTIMEDAMRGGKETLAFARANLPRHIGVLGALLEECWRAGQLRRVPVPIALSFLLGGTSSANCVVGMAEKAGAKRPFGLNFKDFERTMLSDESIKLRVELLLNGLAKKALVLGMLFLVSAADAAEVNLRSVMQLALTRSPEVAAAKARAAEAGLEEPLLLANTDPTIESGYSFTDDRSPRALPAFEGIRTRTEKWDAGLSGKTLLGTETKLNLHNERISNPTLFRPIDPTATSRLSLDVRQHLTRYFLGRPDVARRRRARSNTASAAGRLREVRERAAAGAARAFLEQAFAARQRLIKAAGVVDAEKLLAKYEEKRRYGLAEDSDLLQARANLEVQRAEQLVADSQLERARYALIAALAGEAPALEGASIEGAPAEAEVTEEEALSRRSDVEASRAASESAEWDFRVTKLDTLPDLSFVGSYGFAGLGRSRYSNSMRDMGTWDHAVYTAGAELSIPLAFRRERLTRKAAALRSEAARADAVRVETGARRELRDAREGMRLARLRLAAVHRLMEAERKKYAAEEADFKRGRSSTDLLLRFQQDIRRAEIETARAETDEAAALVELARAQGRLLEGLAP